MMMKQPTTTCFAGFQMLAALSGASGFGRTPGSFSYRTILKNATGVPKANTLIRVQVCISKHSPSGSVIFTEMHRGITNDIGLISLKIGSVNCTAFTAIDWTDGPYYIRLIVNGAETGPHQL
ncbi:MAG: hypothetical protein R6X09_11705 [Bacteroidales bacterium]